MHSVNLSDFGDVGKFSCTFSNKVAIYCTYWYIEGEWYGLTGQAAKVSGYHSLVILLAAKKMAVYVR